MSEFILRSIASETLNALESKSKEGFASIDHDLRMLVGMTLAKWDVEVDYCTIVDLRETRSGSERRIDLPFHICLFSSKGASCAVTIGYVFFSLSSESSANYRIGLCSKGGLVKRSLDTIQHEFRGVDDFLRSGLQWCVNKTITFV